MASILLIVLSSIILLSLLIQWIEIGSSPVFIQTRPGKNEKSFNIIKLKTMNEKRDVKGDLLPDNLRITRFGKFFRSASIDELLQLINVLKGDMSFVGPRPEQAEFTVWLSDEIPFYDLRHQVKPGITGWAQVIFPYGASKEDAIKKLQYELYYIKHQSLFLDLNILVRTLITVFKRSGR